MSNLTLPVLPPSFPAGYCPTPQELANAIAAGLRVILPGWIGLVVIGNNEPTVDQRGGIWYKTEPNANTVVGVCTWSPFYGFWLSNHWLHNGGLPPYNERRIFVGSLSDLEVYDGGEPGTVSDTTGPFWVIDTDWADKWPLGVGTHIAVVDTDASIFSDAYHGDPDARSAYFVKPSGRLFDRCN